ncbi:unnamed protein product [Strongylus vulgaris]|uniref:Ionotropic glutamate receptor C-terminal domain-containing protein n=1 Tax=Strongylus vulgaris TaxID=40348 RepID=A0A3P7JC02_STRVU|nr:unnamed protein product [Strongylus vulgaris]
MLKHHTLDGLKGATLRVLVPSIEPPYVNYANFSDEAVEERGYSPGVVMELLKDIARTLDLKYEVGIFKCGIQCFPPILLMKNKLDPGVVMELLKDIARTLDLKYEVFCSLIKSNGKFEETDIIGGAAIMGYDRSLISDLTYPFETIHTGVLAVARTHHKSEAMLIVTEPFQWQVSVFYHFTFFSIPSYIFKVIAVFSGIPERPRSWSVRILISLWWLASITLMATFTGSLVALFAVEREELPFTSKSDNVLGRVTHNAQYILSQEHLTRNKNL